MIYGCMNDLPPVIAEINNSGKGMTPAT